MAAPQPAAILSRVVTNGSRPLRIGMLIVSEYEANPRVRRQAEALAARGDDVTVLALDAAGRPAGEMIDGVRVVHLRSASTGATHPSRT